MKELFRMSIFDKSSKIDNVKADTYRSLEILLRMYSTSLFVYISGSIDFIFSITICNYTIKAGTFWYCLKKLALNLTKMFL